MKWKRVKGGQQGAAAREKELVNVKKGTLLPSELSGIGAATLQQTGDSLANEDSHDSDHSSEHAHLWHRQRGSAAFSGKSCCDGKPYSSIVYTERGLWPWFLILLNSGIPSLFFMICRGFTLSATYERCFHREDGGELALNIPEVLVMCMTVSSLCVCFCLHWKLNCYQEQTMKHLYWRCLQSEDAEDELALNIADVRGHVCDSGQVFALACTDNYITIQE